MKSLFFVLVTVLGFTQFASAEPGIKYTCQWNHELSGSFTILEGTEEVAGPYYIVLSDDTGYFPKEISHYEIAGSFMIDAGTSQQLQVPTYNDSVDTASCWSNK